MNKIILEMFIPCHPAGQPRTRSTIRGKHSAIYQPVTRKTSAGQTLPTQAVEMRYMVRSMVALALPKDFTPITGPLQVDLQFWFPRSGKPYKRKPNPAMWHTKKPDRDNLDKAILDCLTGLLWNDDNQVCGGYLGKAIVAPGQRTGVHLRVITLGCKPVYPETEEIEHERR